MINIYEPLHHKYRPKSFDELIGQDPITATLKQALISTRTVSYTHLTLPTNREV